MQQLLTLFSLWYNSWWSRHETSKWAKKKELSSKQVGKSLQIRSIGADQVPLDLDVLPELLHGDAGDGHGVADHHPGDGDDVAGREGEDVEHDEQEHGDGGADQDGDAGDVLAAGDLLGALPRRVARNRHLQIKCQAGYADIFPWDQ